MRTTGSRSGDPFTCRWDDDTATLHLHGTVEVVDSRRLTGLLAERSEPAVTVDLSGLDMLPSHTAGVLLEAVRDARRADREVRLTATEGSPAHRSLFYMGLLTR